MKLHIYIAQPDQFAAGYYDSCFTLSTRNDWEIDGWVYVGEVDLNLDAVNRDEVCELAIKGFDARIQEIRAVAQKGVEAIEQRKQNLLALTHEEWKKEYGVVAAE